MNKLLKADSLFVVPSGGFGSRLGRLTQDRVKPSLALDFDDEGNIRRMIDIPLTAIREIGGAALVSTFYIPESLDFIHDYDHVTVAHEDQAGSPIDTLVANMATLEASQASFVGIVAGDTWIEEPTIADMRKTLEVSGCDALILSTQDQEGHNVRFIDKRGLMAEPGDSKAVIADLGVHLMRRDWLLGRLSVLTSEKADFTTNRGFDIWKDIYDINKPKGDILMHAPSFDFDWVDMGTVPDLYRVINKLNARRRDKSGNIVFPKASINSSSSETIILPSGSANVALNRAIVAEKQHIHSANSTTFVQV